MKSRNLIVAAFAIGALPMAWTGGTTTAASDGSDPDVCTDDRVGGEITYGSPAATVSFDPNLVTASTATSSGLEFAALYDTLFVWNPETEEYDPHVAESVTPNDDFTAWTIRLRDGITFGNGDRLNAEAFIASVHRSLDAPAAGLAMRTVIDRLVELTAEDDLTITFELDGPYPEFGDMVKVRPFYIANTRVIDEVGEDVFGSDPTGAGVGPYEFERATFGEEIVFTAKDDYWGGPVCVETLRIITAEDPRLATDSLATGSIDLTTIANPIYIDELRSNDQPGIYVGTPVDYLLLNAADGAPTADINVRRAVAAAVNRDVINQRAYEGTLDPSNGSVVNEQSSYFSEGLSGAPYDLEAAKGFVEEAKASGWDGSIRLLGYTNQTEAVIAIQAMLQAAGMDVTTETLERSEVNQRVSFNADYDIALLQFGNGNGALLAGLGQFQTGGARNQSSFSDPSYDAALDALSETFEPADRQAAMVEFQNVWNDVVPAVVTGARGSYITWNDRLHGVQTSGWDFALLHAAYVEG